MNELENFVLSHYIQMNEVLSHEPKWLQTVLLETRNEHISIKSLPKIKLSADKKYLPLSFTKFNPTNGLSFIREEDGTLVFHPQHLVDLINLSMILDDNFVELDDRVFTTVSLLGAGIIASALGIDLTETENRLINKKTFELLSKSHLR